MGLLKNQFPEVDHGNNDFGYSSFYEAKLSIIDEQNPCYGDTFKIQGKIYELQGANGKLEFVEVDNLQEIEEEQRYEEMMETGNCADCGNAMNDELYCIACNKQWEM